MRHKLRTRLGERLTVTGTFERFGHANGYKGPVKTLVLNEIRSGDEILSDHLWFKCGKTFDALNLEKGDVIQFDARVTEYTKGYMGRRWDVPQSFRIDYRLSYPTKAIKLHSAVELEECGLEA